MFEELLSTIYFKILVDQKMIQIDFLIVEKNNRLINVNSTFNTLVVYFLFLMSFLRKTVLLY